MANADSLAEARLVVVEQEDAYFVARVADPEDWIARFEKDSDFPARAWAENMVRVFNHRLENPAAMPPNPPGTQPATFHPSTGSRDK